MTYTKRAPRTRGFSLVLALVSGRALAVEPKSFLDSLGIGG
jgi:hypothetical protein